MECKQKMRCEPHRPKLQGALAYVFLHGVVGSFYPLFSGVSEEDKKMNELNFKCLKMFTELFHTNSLFIVNNDIKIPDSLKKIKIPTIFS